MEKNSEIKLAEGTLRKLQDYISAKIKERGFEDESLEERLLILTEEMGELVWICRRVYGIGHVKKEKGKTKEDVASEMADIINMLFAVADCLDLDLEKAFYKKEGKIDQRVYRRIKK